MISYMILLSIVIYIISLLIYIIGNLISVNNIKSKKSPPISVIVAVKNGEKSLPNLLNDLKNQTYNGICEYIIVDDQSTDSSQKIIKELTKKNEQFKYVSSIDHSP